MGALLGLLPIIGSLLPHLIPALNSPAAGNILAKASEVANRLFGTNDPGQIEAALKANAELTERFKAELERETASEQAWLADIASARTMQSDAIKSGSKVQWVPVVLTTAIFGLFGIAFYLSVMEHIGSNNVAAQQMVGALIAAFATVIGYWFGSSRSSQSKDAILGQLSTQNQANVAAADKAAGDQMKKMFR